MEMSKRKSKRLPGYDYSQNGAYFVTVCTKDKHKLFGEIVGAVIGRPQDLVVLSECGVAVENAIIAISSYYPCVSVEKYIVMPNHVHLILVISRNESGGRPMTAPTVSMVINQMKGYVSKQIGFSPWQRSFHDHIIRDEHDYKAIWEYIDTNPQKWAEDYFYIEQN